MSHMKVNPNRELQTTASVSRAPQRIAKAAVASETDFQASAKLGLKLAATPEVRAEAVARAKALIADPNYPNPATINKVARRLADNIQQPAAEE